MLPMNDRIYYIDGMKGISALGILSWHFALYTGQIYWPVNHLCSNFLTKILIDGCLVVCIFILLSGFSNALSMSRKHLNIQFVKNTIAKRYLRLAIPIAPILIIIFLMRCFGLMCNYEYAHWASWDSATHCYNVSTMNHLLPLRLIKAILLSPMGDTTGVEMPTWMLKYILIGSYIVLMLQVLTYDMRMRNKIGIACFAMFICGYMISPYYIPMIAGFILLIVNPYLLQTNYKYIISIFSFGFAICCYYFIPQIKFPLNGVITAIFLFIAVMTNPILQKILSFGLFKKLGRVSFMVYLVHMPIICSLSHFLFIHIPINDMATLSLVVYIITTIMVIIVAYFATVWIEEKLSKRIINRMLEKL